MSEEEYPLLSDFLYLCVFVPEGTEPPPRSILDRPELKLYVEDFGRRAGDRALAAEDGGEIAGIVWARLMRDYGWVADDIPSLAVSARESFRGRGIGTRLLTEMADLLRQDGYEAVSLSAQKANRACALYFRLGFEVVRETPEEYVMIRSLRNPSGR